jgi:phosphoribosyl-ATP pyrophosphohydrolase/phosphoribosyl-AMP cyclohydrolase/histidinol dehydrogenase
MGRALASLEPSDRAAMEHAHDRIHAFAAAQRKAMLDCEVAVPGGIAGHRVLPVSSAGCYAPGGRYPLPSSVLMGVATARAAGVERVIVATPGAHNTTLAAAAIAGADEVLAVGGAHAIAAMAHGFEGFPRCDVIVGPGNAWVTAAKHIVSGIVGIDMLAGPSELLVVADETADPGTIAADLLAQAEHDADASAMLVTTDHSLPDRVETELHTQLGTLATRDTARAALANGFACVARDTHELVSLADAIAAEHLEIMMDNAEAIASRIANAGGVFIGAASAEVLGDYGAGPNHTLPTGGTARFAAGLSVSHFLRLRTFLRIDDPAAANTLAADAERLARIEGLHAHAASARLRQR